MFKAKKTSGKTVKAYLLGSDSSVIARYIAEGKIIPRGGGTYEIMSEEAVAGSSGKGEIAGDGDYIKTSSSDYPYPNERDFFLNNHRHISGDDYEQIPKPVSCWDMEQPMCKEIEFLVNCKGLKIDPSDKEKCFSALLWGTLEAAPSDAVIVFYSITYDSAGNITDADFNFVTRNEFEKTYSVEND